MVLMMASIILFVYLFQKKLAKKDKEFREIELLVKQQELESAYSLMQGQEEERKRIAGELHDNIGSLVATIKIYSDLTLNEVLEPKVHKLATKINELTYTLAREVRKLSHELDLRTLSGFGLKVAIEQLCQALTDSGKLEVDYYLDLNESIKDEVSLHLYRIIQELFTNTLKHSLATKVRIELLRMEEDLTLIFEDNGKGFSEGDTALNGMGLQGIRSRLSKINGRFHIDSNSKGSTFIIEIG